MVWNYYFISARWLPPLRINKVKVKVKSKRNIYHPILPIHYRQWFGDDN